MEQERVFKSARSVWSYARLDWSRKDRSGDDPARAFGMPVVAWSRSLTAERAASLGVELKESPKAVASASDVVSVHLALNPETKNLLNADFFNSMREGGYFINTARGEVVDQNALATAMRTRGIRAGLAVYAVEPT